MKYTIFTYTRELRGQDVASLSTCLRGILDEQAEAFASEPRFRLHQQNYRQVRHILARLTHWVDTECGLVSDFDELSSQGRARPFEIEHIWADKYDHFMDWFDHPSDFDAERNRLGGLLLLQRGLNQSIGDVTYKEKGDAYVSHGQNLLARSLHPLAYANNPTFRRLRENTGLPFRPYEHFGQEEQAERQEVYIRIAEWVWNPSRLDLDGVKPPVPEPIVDPEEMTSDPVQRSDRHDARQHFWTELLEYANARYELHTRISPNRYHWAGTRRHGQWWNYVVLQNETPVELYIDSPDPTDNKALFDHLHTQHAAIEAAFGDAPHWQRLDDKRASRVSFTVLGGWADKATWPQAIEQATEAMQRLYGALAIRQHESTACLIRATVGGVS